MGVRRLSALLRWLFKGTKTLEPSGVEVVHFAGADLTLDLAWKHERQYFRYLQEGLSVPQIEVDALVLRRCLSEGARVLDLGANIGFTALQSLEAGASTVLAVEAQPDLFERLNSLRSARINVLNKAISAEVGTAQLFVSETHNQGSTIDPSTVDRFARIFGRKPASVEVEATTIDHLKGHPFDFWKLDIEGAELAALSGATQSLTDHPPRHIYAEIYSADQLAQIRALLSNSHPFQYRVLLEGSGPFQLVLDPTVLPPETRPRRFARHSPSYLFAREEMILRPTA